MAVLSPMRPVEREELPTIPLGEPVCQLVAPNLKLLGLRSSGHRPSRRPTFQRSGQDASEC